MNLFRIRSLLGLLTVLAVGVFFVGCTTSRVPVPENPRAYVQEKAQAADHWREIAIDVAGRVRQALLERDDLIARPLYVAPPNSRPFMLAFHQLLKTEIVSRAMQVSEQRESDSIQIEYDVLTVFHDPSRMNGGVYSRLADMGLAIGSIVGAGHPSGSDHEIVVNVRMSYRNRYVLHLSYIRYINDADWPLYLSPEALEPGSGKPRTVRVINR